MHAYIYQGTNLIGLDETGLSDPYFIIRVYNQIVKGKVVKQTNNPDWNCYIILKDIFLYGTLESIIQNPPEIIIDLYDEDFFLSVRFKINPL